MVFTKINPEDYNIASNVDLRILREDLFPSFGGGNKARKLVHILKEIQSNSYRAVVTTGSIYSNHCRATALMCSNYGLDLSLVIHGNGDAFKNEINAKIYNTLNAKIVFCEPNMISETMEGEMNYFLSKGISPYYLQGGGHNRSGVRAYVDFTLELYEYCNRIDWIPRYIFLPTGTGSTQAGFIIGTENNLIPWQILGISIARKKENGISGITEVFTWFQKSRDYLDKEIHFIDDFVGEGYGKYSEDVSDLTINCLRKNSIFLDPIYSGKAFYGTLKYINQKNLSGKILYVNTGGLNSFKFFSQL